MRQTNAAPAVGSAVASQHPREGWHNVPPSTSPKESHGEAVPDRKAGGHNIPPGKPDKT